MITMKFEKINYFNVNFTSEEYAALCIAKDAIAKFTEFCGCAELIRSEQGKVIKVSELSHTAEILDTLVRSICYKVE